MAGFKLGKAIYITNSTPDNRGGDLAVKLENNRIILRNINQGAHSMVRTAATQLQTDYKHIGAPQLSTLKRFWV